MLDAPDASDALYQAKQNECGEGVIRVLSAGSPKFDETLRTRAECAITRQNGSLHARSIR